MAGSIGDLYARLGLDDSELTKGLKNADSKMAAFGKKMTDIGKSLTTKVTLPIVGLGAAALKMAGDFEVASRKFAGAFAGAEEEASAAVENLSTNFGIASSEATRLLAFTGDLLKGFGATSQEAIQLAEDTNELAAALAAYNGVPVAQASEAITKALLGETESLKQLGVVIRQADVEKQLLAEGTADLTGQELLLAKAQATLGLAMGQSSDAVNNFADNTDTLNFQVSALVGEAKDLAVEFGTILLPVVKDLIAGVREGVEWFSKLDDETKKNILIAAGIAAAMGPVITAVGLAAKAVAGLQTALTFLAANPIVAAIAGVAALTAGVVALVKIGQQRKLDDLTEEFGELAEATGVADEDMKQFLQTAELVEGMFVRNQWSTSMEDVGSQIDQLSANLGLTREQVIGIIRQSENLNDEFKAMVEEIERQRTVQEDLSATSQRREQQEMRITAQQERQAEVAEEARQEEERITEELAEQEAIRQRVEQSYLDTRAEVLSILDSEKTEYEEIQEQLDRLAAHPWSGGQLEADRLAAVEILRKRQQEILDEEAKAAEEAEKERLEAIDEYYRQKAEAAKKAQAEEEARRQAEIEAERQKWQEIISLTQQASSSIFGIIDNLYQIQLNNIDAETQAQIEALDQQALSEEEYQAKVEQLEKQAALKKWEIEKKQFRASQAANIVDTIMNTAQAIMAGYAQLGPIGGSIAAVILAALGATQVGVIASQPPPPRPQLAEGGIISPRAGGVPVTVAEAGDTEAVVPLNDAFFNRLAGAARGEGDVANNTSGGGMTQLTINLDGKTIGQSTVDLINNKQLLVSAKAIR
jgi:hypothetical protein